MDVAVMPAEREALSLTKVRRLFRDSEYGLVVEGVGFFMAFLM